MINRTLTSTINGISERLILVQFSNIFYLCDAKNNVYIITINTQSVTLLYELKISAPINKTVDKAWKNKDYC